MDAIYFLLRYIPFWAVPLMVICAEFAYIFWLKSHTKVSLSFVSITLFCFVIAIFYYWAGGPHHVVRLFDKSIYSIEHY